MHKLIQECEEYLRAGRLRSAEAALNSVPVTDVPRELRGKFANLCRRAGCYSRGLRLLAKVAGPFAVTELTEPTAEEKAEYGVLLLRAGAVTEAKAILDRIDVGSFPTVLLYSAFCSFNLLDFAKARASLEKLMSLERRNYGRTLVKINLLHSLLESPEFGAAETLIREIQREARENKNQRLLSNCYALEGKLRCKQGDFSGARNALRKARKLLDATSSNDLWFIAKWDAFLEARTTQTVSPIKELRKTALAHEDWDALRECELETLRISYDPETFTRLYAGSPYPRFRERLQAEFEMSPNTVYMHQIGIPNDPAVRIVLATGEREDSLVRAVPKVGGQVHKLFAALFADLYRPANTAVLFSRLFPGEHFNIYTSPNRIHRLVSRFRAWTWESELPLELAANDSGFYSLSSSAAVQIRIDLGASGVDAREAQFAALMQSIGDAETFMMRDLLASRHFSRTSIQRILEWALESGRISRSTLSQTHTYHLVRAMPCAA